MHTIRRKPAAHPPLERCGFFSPLRLRCTQPPFVPARRRAQFDYCDCAALLDSGSARHAGRRHPVMAKKAFDTNIRGTNAPDRPEPCKS